MALKVRTVKVSDEMWERWQARAAVDSTSVAALIIMSMEGQAPGPSEADLGDAVRQIVAAKDQEIAWLKGRITFLESEKDITKGLFDQQIAASEQMQARIAELEKAIAVKPASALAAKSAIASLRYDPKMKAVEPTADGKGLVAAVLPVTGTEFPARPVYLRGQDPAKGKGKR